LFFFFFFSFLFLVGVVWDSVSLYSLSFPTAGIIGMHHHTWPVSFDFLLNFL
jgi:hypothetical protein